MPEQTTVWRMFAHDRDDKSYVEAHGLPYPIVEVEARLVDDDDPAATHWAWISSRKGDDAEPSMIWPWRGAYDMCFPYGPEAEEKAGRGRTVRLAVSVVRQDGDGR